MQEISFRWQGYIYKVWYKREMYSMHPFLLNPLILILSPPGFFKSSQKMGIDTNVIQPPSRFWIHTGTFVTAGCI